jgi:hypothetical protein
VDARTFEIHLTIAPIPEARWPEFAASADALGARSLVVVLARGSHPLQPMLTWHREGELADALHFANESAAHPALAPYRVVRCKIEQDGTDALVDAPTHHRYFEWHGRIEVDPSMRERVAEVCQRHGGHLSANAMWGSQARYVTLRGYAAQEELRDRVMACCAALADNGWCVGKQRWERVVHDTDLELDAGWLEPMA